MRRSAVQYYENLNDAAAATNDDGYAAGSTEVWYQKPDFMRDGLMGFNWLAKMEMVPHPQKLNRTHVLLGSIKERNPEKVFAMMQGESWSPVGEARHLIQSKGIGHTSMSVGDIMAVGSKTLLVDTMGFKDISHYRQASELVSRVTAKLREAHTDKIDNEPRPPRMKKPKVTPAAHRVYKLYTQDLLHDILVDKYGTKRGTENFEYFVQKGGGAFYAVGQAIQDEKAQMYQDLGETPPSDYFKESYYDAWKRWMARPMVAREGRVADAEGKTVEANTTELRSWLDWVQKITNDDYAKNYPNSTPPVFELMPGSRYIRVVKKDSVSRSAFAFVRKDNGDILMAASWSAPAKHARGNLFAPDGGKSALGPGGHVRYLARVAERLAREMLGVDAKEFFGQHKGEMDQVLTRHGFRRGKTTFRKREVVFTVVDRKSERGGPYDYAFVVRLEVESDGKFWLAVPTAGGAKLELTKLSARGDDPPAALESLVKQAKAIIERN